MKSEKISESRLINRIRNRLKGMASGEVDYVCEKYEMLYGKTESPKRALAFRKRIYERYAVVVIICALLIVTDLCVSGSDRAEKYVSENNGRVTVMRPEKGQEPLYINMKMKVRTENGKTVVKDIQVMVEAINNEEVNETTQDPAHRKTDREILEENIRSAVSSVNSNVNSRQVVLPESLAGGEKVYWEKNRKSEIPLILAGFVTVIFLIFRNRFSDIKKEERNARNSIVRELPDFINNLIMLLNAGEVVNTAFLTIMENKLKRENISENYFYSQMSAIYTKIKTANASLDVEIREFSRRSRVRELMRISNILSDNIRMGSDLVEKLTKESEMLWFARKKQSEEKGRTAETKMTFPLVILLLVLVMITVAPAMLEM